MKKLLLLSILTASTLTAFGQAIVWGQWENTTCWGGMHWRAAKNYYNEYSKAYEWDIQFQNDYVKAIHFDYSVLTPQQNAAYQSGTLKLTAAGRVDIKAQQATGDGITTGYPLWGLYASNTIIYVVIFNVRFGDDDSGAYAVNDCGKSSAYNAEAASGSTANATQLSYGDDVATPTQGPYNLWTEKDGVSIYSAWVTMSGNPLSVSLKVVNNNSYPVIVTWEGPRWYKDDVYIDPLAIPRIAPDQFGYSDKYSPGETKDASQHTPGMNGAEVYEWRPNWLSYTAPKGVWAPKQLDIKLINLQILNTDGKPFGQPAAVVNKPAVENVQKPVTEPVASKPVAATAKPVSFPRVATVSNNVNVQNAITEINEAQSATDAIAQTNYLNQADLKLLYEQTHGNNTPQVQQLRQQIANLQKQYNNQNAAALQNSINNTASGSSSSFSSSFSDTASEIMNKNSGLETEKANNKTEVKKSMSDFFNNVNFDKQDTTKTDTTKRQPLKQ